MKTQTLTPILVVIILLVESIFSVSLAANSQLTQKAVTITDGAVLANNTEPDPSPEQDDDEMPVKI